MLTLNDGRAELWQWDTGRTLQVDAECSQVHFSNKVFGRSIDVDVTDRVAIVPDVLLQTDKDLNVWAFVGTAENGYTKISKTFKVNRRNKPADYVFTPVEQTTIAEIAAIAKSVRDDADAGFFDGRDGVDGYTPMKGVDYFDGKDGTDGAPGADGKTPVYGVDYGTPEQIAGIAQSAADILQPEVNQIKDDLASETRRALEAEDNRIKKFYTGNHGAVNITDSDDGAVRNLVIGGNCVQADNPSPDNPQEIRWATNVTMTVSQAEGTQRQTAPVPFILRGLSNVWDALYVYADGTGKFVQRIGSALFDVGDGWEPYTIQNTNLIHRYGTQILNGKQKSVDNGWISNAMCSISVPISANGGYAGNMLGFSVNKDGMTSFYVPSTDFPDVSSWTTYLQANPVSYVYELKKPIETVLSKEQVTNLFALRTYYGGTNIAFTSENGVEPVVNFDYACALENFVEYIKTAQGDDRKFIYDMDERMTDVEYVTALAYVNSEYAAAITELEV